MPRFTDITTKKTGYMQDTAAAVIINKRGSFFLLLLSTSLFDALQVSFKNMNIIYPFFLNSFAQP